MHVERNTERSRASMASRWTYKARRDQSRRDARAESGWTDTETRRERGTHTQRQDQKKKT
jgi:hypothetical protein